MKRSIWSAAALALAAAGPVACGEAPVEETANPEAPEGVTVNNARLMLPPVPGNPGAVYFDIVNGGEKDRMIAAVSVAGAGSAVIYYTTDAARADVARVVTTVSTDPESATVPARFVSYLATGQKAQVSLAGAVGTPPAVLEYVYNGDRLAVRPVKPQPES